MKKIRWAFIVAGFVIITTTCNKDEDSPIQENALPEPTPVGTETGSISVKTIGPEGGTISSYDGKLDVEFPEGALNSETDISVQAVTNYAPGGTGDAYRIGPSGTQLNMPVNMKFHYSDNNISGSLPMFLGMAVQDTNQIWYNLGNPILDPVNKTIIVKSKKLFAPASKSARNKGTKASNFLDHATFLDLFIFPEAAELKKSESQAFQVYAIQNHSPSDEGNEEGDEDYLPPLPRRHEVSPNTVKQWSVNGEKNGNAEFGIVLPNGSACTYTAPGEKPSINPVDLTADIKLWYRDPETGRDFNNLKINAPILIIDEHYSYELEILFKFDNWGTWAFVWDLADKATMDVDVINGIVSISNIRNSEGTVSPVGPQTKVIIEGVQTCTGTVLASAVGLLNVTQGSGQVLFNDLDPRSPWLILKITNSDGIIPRWSYECTNELPAFTGGGTYPTAEYTLQFVRTNEIQKKDDFYLAATLTPKAQLP